MPMMRLRAQFAAQRAGGQADRAKAGDQDGVVAADADLLEAFIDGAEAAGHLRAVGVGQVVRKSDQVLLLGDHVIGHAAIALPAVGAAVFRAGAGDHVAAAAIVAHAAAGDVIHDDAVARFEAAAARPGLDDLPGTARARRSRPGSPRAPCRDVRDRCSGYRSRRWWRPSCGAAPRRGPGSGTGTSRSSTVLLPGRYAPLIVLSLFRSLARLRRRDLAIQVPQIFPGLVLLSTERPGP